MHSSPLKTIKSTLPVILAMLVGCAALFINYCAPQEAFASGASGVGSIDLSGIGTYCMVSKEENDYLSDIKVSYGSYGQEGYLFAGTSSVASRDLVVSDLVYSNYYKVRAYITSAGRSVPNYANYYKVIAYTDPVTDGGAFIEVFYNLDSSGAEAGVAKYMVSTNGEAAREVSAAEAARYTMDSSTQDYIAIRAKEGVVESPDVTYYWNTNTGTIASGGAYIEVYYNMDSNGADAGIAKYRISTNGQPAHDASAAEAAQYTMDSSTWQYTFIKGKDGVVENPDVTYWWDEATGKIMAAYTNAHNAGLGSDPIKYGEISQLTWCYEVENQNWYYRYGRESYPSGLNYSHTKAESASWIYYKFESDANTAANSGNAILAPSVNSSQLRTAGSGDASVQDVSECVEYGGFYMLTADDFNATNASRTAGVVSRIGAAWYLSGISSAANGTIKVGQFQIRVDQEQNSIASLNAAKYTLQHTEGGVRNPNNYGDYGERIAFHGDTNNEWDYERMNYLVSRQFTDYVLITDDYFMPFEWSTVYERYSYPNSANTIPVKNTTLASTDSFTGDCSGLYSQFSSSLGSVFPVYPNVGNNVANTNAQLYLTGSGSAFGGRINKCWPTLLRPTNQASSYSNYYNPQYYMSYKLKDTSGSGSVYDLWSIYSKAKQAGAFRGKETSNGKELIDPENRDSGLMWFCFGNSLYAQSFVELQSPAIGGKSASTEFATDETVQEATVANDDSEVIVTGETVNVKFGHDSYADTPHCDWCSLGNVIHSVERTISFNGGTEAPISNSFSGGTLSVMDGSADHQQTYGGMALLNTTTIGGSNYYYAAWTKTMGSPTGGTAGELHARGDWYAFVFNEPGVYEICEKFSVDGTQFTKTCAKVTVGGKGLYGQSAVHIQDRAAAKTGLATKTAPESVTARTTISSLGRVYSGCSRSRYNSESACPSRYRQYNYYTDVTVKFGNSAYSTEQMYGDENVNLKVERFVKKNGATYDLSTFFGSNISVVNGTLDRTKDYGEHSLYWEKNVEGRDLYWWKYGPDFAVNGLYYERGDAYKIRISGTSTNARTSSLNGTFDMCERLYVNGSYYSEACAEITVGTPTTYYAQSTVTATPAGGLSNEATTARTRASAVAAANAITVVRGNRATVTFSHSAYANYSTSNVGYSIDRSNTNISGATRTALTGTVNLTVRDADSGLYSTSSKKVRSTQSYTFTFNSTGNYYICQTLTVQAGTQPHTRVCAYINVVDENSDPNTCLGLAPSSYLQSTSSKGWSSVLARVRLQSSTSLADWTRELWARPGDAVTWIHCYYPGAQKVANSQWVTTSHGAHGGHSPTSNTNKLLKNGLGNSLGTVSQSGSHSGDSTRTSWGSSYATVVSSINPTQVPTFCAKASDNGGCKIYNSGIAPITKLTGSIGNSNILSKSDPYTIGQGRRTSGGGNIDRAGHTLTETITMSNTPSYAKAATGTNHTWSHTDCSGSGENRTCSTHNVSHSNQYYSGAVVQWYARTDQAVVRIPYNYNNTDDAGDPTLPGAEVKFRDDAPQINDGDVFPDVEDEEPNDVNGGKLGIVYSGETITVDSAFVRVGVKDNSSVNQGQYATQVDHAQVKMIAYVTESYSSSSKVTGATGSDASQLCNSTNINNKGLCRIVNSMANNETPDPDTGSGNTLTLNPNGNSYGAVHGSGNFSNNTNAESVTDLKGSSDYDSQEFATTYNVFDADAGDYFCMVIAVYPASSGADSNWQDAEGDHKWYISAPDCRIIAKRPSLQVWGGSVYSSGSMRTTTATKTNVYGVYDNMSGSTYKPFLKTNTTLFGSWGEQSIVSLGSVTGFASGAGMGLAATSSTNKVKSGSLEGSDPNYCKNQTTLSLANYGSSDICDNEQATGHLGITPAVPDRKALVNYWLPEDRSTSGTVASATGKTIEYTYSNGEDLTIGATDVGRDTTRVYYANAGSYDGNVIINGDIKYTSESLGAAGNIPKVVIYAGGDIKISCSVKQVDALLIAEGTVDTCYQAAGSDGVHGTDDDYEQKDSRRSVQLTIRGVVIADKMILGRTYGTAAGSDPDNTNHSDQTSNNLANSSIPAEVVNYDTSAILWSSYMAGSAESDTLTTIYQRELAPRY